MGFFPIVVASLLAASSVSAPHCVYLMMRGRADEAVHQYRQVSANSHDKDLLRQMALTLFSADYGGRAPQEQIATLFGIGLSGARELLPLLSESISSQSIEVQLTAIDLLAAVEDSRALELLTRALSSPFLVCRLHALCHLAERRAPDIALHIQALEVKTPHELRPLFPRLYAMIEAKEAASRLKQLLSDPDRSVACETVRCLAEGMRREFANDILRLSHQIDPSRQEACAFALGVLGGEGAHKRLEELSGSQHAHVALAAQNALGLQGYTESAETICAAAERGDPFAISLLGEMEAGIDSLVLLLRHPEPDIQLNAAVSLLRRRDGRGIPQLLEHVFRSDPGHFLKVYSSLGGTLTALKTSPSTKETGRQEALVLAESEYVRTTLLHLSAQLPEEEFLKCAAHILERRLNSLVPTCVAKLEEMQTRGAKALLRQGQEQIGAPLVRGYCNLALLRLGEPGPYKAHVLSFVKQCTSLDPAGIKRRMNPQGNMVLAPEEMTQLFIESIEALVDDSSAEAIDLLLASFETYDPTHVYTLGGLLLRLVS